MNEAALFLFIFLIQQEDDRVILACLIPGAHLFLERFLVQQLAFVPQFKQEIASEHLFESFIVNAAQYSAKLQVLVEVATLDHLFKFA